MSQVSRHEMRGRTGGYAQLRENEEGRRRAGPPLRIRRSGVRFPQGAPQISYLASIEPRYFSPRVPLAIQDRAPAISDSSATRDRPRSSRALMLALKSSWCGGPRMWPNAGGMPQEAANRSASPTVGNTIANGPETSPGIRDCGLARRRARRSPRSENMNREPRCRRSRSRRRSTRYGLSGRSGSSKGNRPPSAVD
jgi:hypothetical protein